MTNFKEAFSAVALAATVGLTGCAGTHFTAPFSDPRDSAVVNRPQDRGVKEYASQACRDAKATVVSGHRRVLRGEFDHVISVNGIPHTIIFPDELRSPNSLANRPITVGGTVVGGLLGGDAARGHSPSTQAAAGVGGAVAGYIVGQMGDNYMKAGNAEARESCVRDTRNGAYDGGAYDRPQHLGPGYRQQNYQYQQPEVIQGYRRIEPARGPSR